MKYEKATGLSEEVRVDDMNASAFRPSESPSSNYSDRYEYPPSRVKVQERLFLLQYIGVYAFSAESWICLV